MQREVLLFWPFLSSSTHLPYDFHIQSIWIFLHVCPDEHEGKFTKAEHCSVMFDIIISANASGL